MSNFGRRTIQLRETTTRQPRLGLARLLCFLAKHNQPLEQKQCGNMINTGIQKYGTNSILILIIYSKLSMNVIKLFALHVLLLPPQKKVLEVNSGGVTRFCFTFIPRMPTNTELLNKLTTHGLKWYEVVLRRCHWWLPAGLPCILQLDSGMIMRAPCIYPGRDVPVFASAASIIKLTKAYYGSWIWSNRF